MSSKKEIKISKKLVFGILGAFFISVVILFIVQNFGTFSYQSENKTNSAYEYGTDRILLIKYESLLGTTITNYQLRKPSLNYQASDMMLEGKFHIYSNKFPYYIQATFKDIKYALLAWAILSLVLIALTKIKFKIE